MAAAFGATVYVTEPLPTCWSGDVSVTHVGTLAGFTSHGQPSNVVTFTPPSPPSTPGVAAAALSAYVHVAWLTLNGLPATVSEVVRAAPLVFGATLYSRGPLPTCGGAGVIVAHGTRLVAAHVQASPVMTFTLPAPPIGGKDVPVVLSSAYEQALCV